MEYRGLRASLEASEQIRHKQKELLRLVQKQHDEDDRVRARACEARTDHVASDRRNRRPRAVLFPRDGATEDSTQWCFWSGVETECTGARTY